MWVGVLPSPWALAVQARLECQSEAGAWAWRCPMVVR
jgi:hypothetical protein